MSVIDDVVAALIAEAESALPSYTAINDGFIQLVSVDDEQFPIGMMFNPTSANSRLPMKQNNETITVAVALARAPGEGVLMRADVQALVEALQGNTTLGGAVDDAFFISWEVDDTQTARTLGVLVMEAARVSVDAA